MRRTLWNALFGFGIAAAALVVSPTALSASKKTPTPAAEASTAKTSSDKSAKTEKVNLNTADEKTIAGAKGVGEKLAKELVKNRPYKTWEEVSKVKGVGSGKKLESLKTVLKLTEGVGAAPAKEAPAAAVGTGAAAGGAAASGAAALGASGSGKASAASEPASPSKKSSSSSSASASPKLAPGTKININTASKEELDALPEIGPVKAQAIVDYRNANGKFAAPEDIMKVSGIKEGTFAKIKDYIVVK
ncbi:MAG: ComEA family DNA-binding protein [Thermoanaerobaculia bacterium]